MLRRLFLILALSCATPVLAHPHMFIQTAVAVLFDDQGRATGIRVTWIYDSFTSLQLLADEGMDPQMSGTLTAAETAQLNGFDMGWRKGYEGDSFARLDQQPLHLSGPRDWTLTYADGVITTTHMRDFDAPQSLADHVLGVQTYDPGYYVLYELSSQVELLNLPPEHGCRAIFRPADTAKAKKDLEAQLRALQGTAEVSFPPVGKTFAAEAWILCTKAS